MMLMPGGESWRSDLLTVAGGGRAAEADAGPAAGRVGVGVAVAAELFAQHGHEPGLDEHGGPGPGAALLHLADDLLPGGGQGEIVRAIGGRRPGRGPGL